MSDDGITLADWFTAELAACTPSMHAMTRHLPTRDEANAIAAKHYAIGIVSRDAAHAASFGVDVERDMAFDAAEDAEHCERCDGSGWLEVADGYVECTCGEAV